MITLSWKDPDMNARILESTWPKVKMRWISFSVKGIVDSEVWGEKFGCISRQTVYKCRHLAIP